VSIDENTVFIFELFKTRRSAVKIDENIYFVPFRTRCSVVDIKKDI